MPITKSPPHLASRLRVSIARLARRLRQEGSPDDSTPSQLTALSTLFNEGPMTIGALAAAERVKPPSMTRVLAALEERGLVERETSPKDARVVFVKATEAGRRSHEEYRKRRDAWLAQQLNKLSAEDRDILAKAADVLDRMAEPT
jgi:DNA-binding MarR family transcriptional regulator